MTAGGVQHAVIDRSALVAPAHPWRRVARTLLVVGPSLLPVVPSIVDALGVSRTVPMVAAVLTLAAAGTRVLALPAVEVWLRRAVPRLSAGDVAAEDVVTQVIDVDAEFGVTAPIVVTGEAHGQAGAGVVVDELPPAHPAARRRKTPRKRKGGPRSTG